MDRDKQATIALLDSALRASGMSATVFATALGTSASRFSTYRSGHTAPSGWFCMRALRLGRALGDARARRLYTSLDAAMEIRDALDTEWMWRALLQSRDHLRLMLSRRDGSAAAWEPKPGSTGRPELDTMLAAMTAREFERAGEDAPSWSTEITALDNPWIPEHPFLDASEIIAATPEYLSRFNIFVPERDLVTA